MKDRPWLWDWLIFVSMGLFGMYALFVKINQPAIEPVAFLLFFQVVGALVFGVFYGLVGFPMPGPRERVLLFALALVAIANDLALFSAFTYARAADVVLAHQMEGAAMLIFAPWLLAKRTQGSEWLAFAISLIGAVILYQGNNEGTAGVNQSLGIALGLVSAVFLALLIILYNLLRERGVHIITVNAWRYGLSLMLLLPLVPLSPGMVPNITNPFGPGNLGVLVTFGLLFAVLASGIHTMALSHARPMHSSIINNVESVMAALWAFAILGEKPGVHTFVGGGLILASSVWIAIPKRRTVC